ncbi:phospholipase D family protein [Sorangium sp. So ce1153]|uniref:phospholipase D family protein n=1 Tax=Sorangium sp. So ce1153 TaxID=3133333 RepID=UPI003F5EB67E
MSARPRACAPPRARARAARTAEEARPRVQLERQVHLTLLRDRAHYDTLVMGAVAKARVSVWIATANVKELRIEAPVGSRARARGRYMSFLDLLDALAARGVELRLLHAGVPSRAFRAELRRRPRSPIEMRRCPRVHLKMIAVDGALLYLGSANLTGAGLGAKGEGRRNFEAGVLTDDDLLLDEMQATFDAIWTGAECKGCRLRPLCPAPLDQIEKSRCASGRDGR